MQVMHAVTSVLLIIVAAAGDQTCTKAHSKFDDSKVVFAMIARDASDELESTIRNIEAAGALFKDWNAIVYENDSRDNTLELLEEWARVNPDRVRVASETGVRDQYDAFTERLGYARNKYMEAIERAEYASFDYLVVVDTDMCIRWSIGDNLKTIASMQEPWSMISANGVGAITAGKGTQWVYQDRFAYRDEYSVCWDPSDGVILIHPQAPKFALRINNVFDPRGPPVPVTSAFGGFAIYKIAHTKGCRYKPMFDDCEHISFHRCMQEQHGAKLFVHPAVIVEWKSSGGLQLEGARCTPSADWDSPVHHTLASYVRGFEQAVTATDAGEGESKMFPLWGTSEGDKRLAADSGSPSVKCKTLAEMYGEDAVIDDDDEEDEEMAINEPKGGALEDADVDVLSEEPSTFEVRLTAFYQRYNPEKIGEVQAMLAKFAGKEARLFELLRLKYGVRKEDLAMQDAQVGKNLPLYNMSTANALPPPPLPPLSISLLRFFALMNLITPILHRRCTCTHIGSRLASLPRPSWSNPPLQRRQYRRACPLTTTKTRGSVAVESQACVCLTLLSASLLVSGTGSSTQIRTRSVTVDLTWRCISTKRLIRLQRLLQLQSARSQSLRSRRA
jgi:hypothetical protein